MYFCDEGNRMKENAFGVELCASELFLSRLVTRYGAITD